MIPCEEFERSFPYDQSAEVLKHQKLCPYCGQFTAVIAGLRRALAGIPQFSAPVGFENRLHNRLDELDSKSVKEWRIVPNAAAFASGLALVLFAGALYTHYMKQNQQTTFTGQNTEVSIMAEAETDSTVQDSTKTLQDPWAQYWNFETVSTQP